jgi:chemotaxis protein methyltransferase CheR
MNVELTGIAELLERETGIHTKAARLPALAAAIGRVAPSMDAAQFLAELGDAGPASTRLLARLTDEVAIQETYFLRDPRELQAIDWRALQSAAYARGEQDVRVWVCACASGEEAYSVAMLAVEAFGHERAPVSILATDVSERALERARAALYNERSTREIDQARRERFFRDRGGKDAVGEQLRSMVRFRKHNLIADAAPPLGESCFDLILCRNVLIYFDTANVELVVGSLELALRPGGQLILGASDRLTSSARRFAEVAARAGRSPVSAERSIPRGRLRAAPKARRPPLTAAGTSERAPAPSRSPARVVTDARAAADVGNYVEAIDITGEILARDPLDAEAYFVRGLSELAAGDPGSATGSLRRALYIDPAFALAAFQLGRAHDLCGQAPAATRAYRRALRTLDPDDERYPHLLERVNAGDIAAACRTRLAAARS